MKKEFKTFEEDGNEVRFTLRLPKKFDEIISSKIEKFTIKMSKNRWIVQAIAKELYK